MDELVASVTASGLPALIAGAGSQAVLRFLEFFTVNIRNKNTLAAYARVAGDFLRWCEGQGIGELGRVQPVYVGGLHRAIAGRALGSHGQATSGLYPHAV